MAEEAGDITIWNQLRDGDPRALLNLYKEYYISLINFGTKMTGNRDLTNDCISQVLIKLWNKHANLPEVGNIRSYLITCLKNELLNELKSINKMKIENEGFRKEFAEQEISYEDHLIQIQTNTEIKNNLSRAFSHLSKREKQLLQMKFFDALSYEEIALKCNITKRTAYNIIHASLKALRAEFKRSDTPVSFYGYLLPAPVVACLLYRYINYFFSL